MKRIIINLRKNISDITELQPIIDAVQQLILSSYPDMNISYSYNETPQ
jgi:hypothetical protein